MKREFGMPWFEEEKREKRLEFGARGRDRGVEGLFSVMNLMDFLQTFRNADKSWFRWVMILSLTLITEGHAFDH